MVILFCGRNSGVTVTMREAEFAAPYVRRYLAELNELSQRKYASPFSHMMLHKGLGELEQVFKWLEIACVERDPYVRGLKTDPLLDDLRADARFTAILRQAGLP